jgi:short subunit dehydrogenase-like uncharacterized protein
MWVRHNTRLEQRNKLRDFAHLGGRAGVDAADDVKKIRVGDLLFYGAYGYTGELVARRAVERGLRPILAGRDPAPLARLARELALPERAFALDDPADVDRGLSGVSLVVHCAGPYVRTYRPMAEACLRARSHYVDLTGEIPVLKALRGMGADAQRAGIMLLPAAGFDVVPTDCLAAHLARRLPGARRLALAIEGFEAISQGTARTMLEPPPPRPAERPSGGAPRRSTAPPVRRIDLGAGARRALSVPWGDVYTAPISTGIEDVAVYMVVPPALAAATTLALAARPLLRFSLLREGAVRLLTFGRRGPTEALRRRNRVRVWGEAVGSGGERVAARLVLPEIYRFTALAAVEIAERVLRGEATPGFQTPSLAFGPDLVLALPGVLREDLD